MNNHHLINSVEYIHVQSSIMGLRLIEFQKIRNSWNTSTTILLL